MFHQSCIQGIVQDSIGTRQGIDHHGNYPIASMQNKNHCSLALHLFAFFITFYLYVIQPEVLILFPTAIVYLDLYIWIWIWRIQVLHIGVCQWVVKNDGEGMFGIFHLGQFSIKVASPTNVISYRFKLPQEDLELVASLDIGADWVSTAD